MASNSGLSDLPKCSLSWLPSPSQGTAFPVEILLSVLIQAQFLSFLCLWLFSFPCWDATYLSLCLTSAFIVSLLYRTPFCGSFSVVVPICTLAYCFQPSIGGTYLSMPVSKLFKTWEVGLDFPGEVCNEQRGTQLEVCSLEFIVQFCLCCWESLFFAQCPLPCLVSFLTWLLNSCLGSGGDVRLSGTTSVYSWVDVSSSWKRILPAIPK